MLDGNGSPLVIPEFRRQRQDYQSKLARLAKSVSLGSVERCCLKE